MTMNSNPSPLNRAAPGVLHDVHNVRGARAEAFSVVERPLASRNDENEVIPVPEALSVMHLFRNHP